MQPKALLTLPSHLKQSDKLLFNQVDLKILFRIPTKLPTSLVAHIKDGFAFVGKVTFSVAVINSCQANSVPRESHRS